MRKLIINLLIILFFVLFGAISYAQVNVNPGAGSYTTLNNAFNAPRPLLSQEHLEQIFLNQALKS